MGLEERMRARVACRRVSAAVRGATVVAAVAALSSASCFFDSRWVQQKLSQEAAVAHATPKGLATGAEGDRPNAALRVMRVSAHATPRHAAEVVDWTRQLEGMIDGANQVLGPALGIRLEVAETKLWAVQGDEESLRALLDELRTADAGQGVDWVIGLSGSLPRAEESFHELGVATRPGKHLVMRAMNDAREYELIQKELTRIDEAERRKLYAVRKKHKATVVLLHELGHTMGVIHQPDPSAIMNPRYSVKAERFDAAATAWMKAFLRDKAGALEPGEPPFVATIFDLLTKQPDAWVPAERDELTKLLAGKIVNAALAAQGAGAAGAGPASAGGSAGGQAGTQGAAGSGGAPGPAGGSSAGGSSAGGSSTGGSPAGSAAGGSSGAPAASSLSAVDQKVFDEAFAKEKAGKYTEAYDQAKPLYKRYPDEMSVQDLRCRLVLQLDVPVETVESECAALMRLSGVKKKKK
jgi:hypothetical protein